MARVLWLCHLIEYPRPGFWCPALVRVHGGPLGPFPAVWTTTPGAIPHPWACGVAEVTDAQFVALTQEAGLQLFVEATERPQPVHRLAPARGQALTTFLQQRGLPPPSETERIGDVLDRVIAAHEPGKTVQRLLEDLATEIGHAP